ncbi:uncharacterized protein [Lepeophtheirus salmonis]|nr:uncharacterized protein LOC121114690 [Lepeophtheirus salmonis]
MLKCRGDSNEESPLSLNDLNFKEFGKIFSSYTGEVIHVKNVLYEAPIPDWCNDNFSSNITKLKVVTEDDDVFHIIAKATIEKDAFLHQCFVSINRFFFKEYIWYFVARPLLQEKWPIVKDFSPNAYYGNVNTGKTLDSTCYLDYFGPLALLFKKEKSLLLIENMCEKNESERYKVFDKYPTIDLDIALSACQTMAHFHGVWKQFLYSKKHVLPDPESSSTSPQDFLSHYETDFGTWSHQKIFKPFLEMCREMIINNTSDNDAGEYLASRYFSYVTSEKMDSLIGDMYSNSKRENSKLKTMNHGDFSINNILYRPSDNHVIMIDYQLMQVSHPAKDFWYFVYTCTDKDWRERHLEDLKKAYFETYSSYLIPEFQMEYDEFSKEFETRRGIILFVPLIALMIFKYPEKLDKKQMIIFGSDYKEMMSCLAKKESESDHPGVKRVRKLILEAIQEASDLGIFRKNVHV